MAKYYQYYVEGQDEEKLIQVLKTELRLIEPGKVEKFNVVSEELTKLRIMSLKMGTIVVLVFDTDAGNINTLKKNIKFLKEQKAIKNVLCITQVKNLEDELKRSCDIKDVKELTGSKSNSDFKHDIRKEKQFGKKLHLTTDYTGIGKLQYLIAQNQVFTLDTRYTDSVTIDLMVPEEKFADFCAQVTEATSGQAQMDSEDLEEFGIVNGEIIF